MNKYWKTYFGLPKILLGNIPGNVALTAKFMLDASAGVIVVLVNTFSLITWPATGLVLAWLVIKDEEKIERDRERLMAEALDARFSQTQKHFGVKQ